MQLVPDFAGTGISLNGNACSVCNNIKRPEDPGVISTGLFVESAPYVPGATEEGDKGGAIEVCYSCAREMASYLGLVPEEDSEELRKTNRRLGLQVSKLERRLADNDTIGQLIKAHAADDGFGTSEVA